MLTTFFDEKRNLHHLDNKSFLHNFLHKSILGFEKWTKKMSKNEKTIYFCAKSDATLRL
jgi:hypothetical protein